ncbi:hypothetical protein JOY44_28905 [Phormidium sp. CLA17]|nr:hypothetical protein [Leptolyngbya sp. Cla-17]MBM0745445.1 hypothetical protein [Leptolyngbya sp. Cla-17]
MLLPTGHTYEKSNSLSYKPREFLLGVSLMDWRDRHTRDTQPGHSFAPTK